MLIIKARKRHLAQYCFSLLVSLGTVLLEMMPGGSTIKKYLYGDDYGICRLSYSIETNLSKLHGIKSFKFSCLPLLPPHPIPRPPLLGAHVWGDFLTSY
jgi:hypothetical protein